MFTMTFPYNSFTLKMMMNWFLFIGVAYSMASTYNWILYCGSLTSCLPNSTTLFPNSQSGYAPLGTTKGYVFGGYYDCDFSGRVNSLHEIDLAAGTVRKIHTYAIVGDSPGVRGPLGVAS